MIKNYGQINSAIEIAKDAIEITIKSKENLPTSTFIEKLMGLKLILNSIDQVLEDSIDDLTTAEHESLLEKLNVVYDSFFNFCKENNVWEKVK